MTTGAPPFVPLFPASPSDERILPKRLPLIGVISSPVKCERGHDSCNVSRGPSRSRQLPRFARAAQTKSGGTMAKKARKRTAIVQGVQPPTPSFDEMFPTIARWISQEEGWVELGADHHSR